MSRRVISFAPSAISRKRANQFLMDYPSLKVSEVGDNGRAKCFFHRTIWPIGHESCDRKELTRKMNDALSGEFNRAVTAAFNKPGCVNWTSPDTGVSVHDHVSSEYKTFNEFTTRVLTDLDPEIESVLKRFLITYEEFEKGDKFFMASNLFLAAAGIIRTNKNGKVEYVDIGKPVDGFDWWFNKCLSLYAVFFNGDEISCPIDQELNPNSGEVDYQIQYVRDLNHPEEVDQFLLSQPSTYPSFLNGAKAGDVVTYLTQSLFSIAESLGSELEAFNEANLMADDYSYFADYSVPQVVRHFALLMPICAYYSAIVGHMPAPFPNLFRGDLKVVLAGMNFSFTFIPDKDIMKTTTSSAMGPRSYTVSPKPLMNSIMKELRFACLDDDEDNRGRSDRRSQNRGRASSRDSRRPQNSQRQRSSSRRRQ